LQSFFMLGFCSELFREGFRFTSSCGIWNIHVNNTVHSNASDISVIYSSQPTDYLHAVQPFLEVITAHVVKKVHTITEPEG
jgi:hypothetical protein